MTNRASVSTDQRVPPHVPQAADGARLRVLFVSGYELGWRTYAAEMESLTARRDDIDALHVRVAPSRMVRLVGKRFPPKKPFRGWLDPHLRRLWAGRAVFGRWLDRNVDLDDFDLVHVAPHFPAMAVLARARVTPVVVSIDATGLQAKAQRRGLSLAETERKWRPTIELERRILDRVQGIVCLSAWACDGLEVAHQGRAVVIPPRVDVTPASVERVDDLTRLLFVGNDWSRKGGQRLVDWHQKHLVGRVELHLCGSHIPEFDGVQGIVRHGHIERDELLRELTPRMDALVLPTRSDMSPLAITEALASGLPVVSSDIGGIGELVEHGVTGFLLDPDDDAGYVDTLRSLADDPDLRVRLRESAMGRALSVDRDAADERLVAWWRSVAGTPRHHVDR